MGISNKIKDKIDKFEIDNEMKNLMLNILTIEDKGNYKYVEAYEKVILEHLNGKEN